MESGMTEIAEARTRKREERCQNIIWKIEKERRSKEADVKGVKEERRGEPRSCCTRVAIRMHEHHHHHQQAVSS